MTLGATVLLCGVTWVHPNWTYDVVPVPLCSLTQAPPCQRRLVLPQDGNRAGQPKADPRPDGLWVGFGQLFGKNHLTQTQPDPTWKLIRLGSGRWFNHLVLVWSPKKVPDPLKRAKIVRFVEPGPTQPNANSKCSKTGSIWAMLLQNWPDPNEMSAWIWALFFDPNLPNYHPEPRPAWYTII
jgi:hypothetical protein